MGDVNPTVTDEAEVEEEFVEETTVARTFAYSASVIIQIIWMVITTLLLISDNHHGHLAWWDIAYLEEDVQGQATKPSIGPWEVTNHATGKLIPCLLLPLLIILPPIYRRRKYRVFCTLVLCSLGLLLQALHLISSLVWAAQAEIGSLKVRVAELLLREVIAAVLAALLGVVLHTTYRAWKEGKASNVGVDINQSYLHGAHVCLVVLSAVAVIDSSSKYVSNLLPLSLFTMLLLVQLRHYATSHIGFFTRQRAISTMNKFVKEFSLTKIEKDLIKKPQTERVIDNMLTKPLYPRNLCPC